MANRLRQDCLDIGQVIDVTSELRELAEAADPVGTMTRQLREAQAVYQPLPRPEVMRSLASEVESIASAIPESVASIPRNVAASRPENLLERTLDRNQMAQLRIAKQQLDAVASARKHLEMLKSSGIF
jgi:hypothetical protein